VLACAPAVFSFTFGIPPASVLEPFKSRGILLAGTATSVEEARRLMGLWAGQGSPLSRDVSATELVQALLAEAESLIGSARAG
jgi:NAD(P)H-dependent flavin oxidoreductase YrpB (nitropropane dioxygenase family)